MVNVDKADDLSLISRFKAGDISAFEEILIKHQDRIYNVCRYMLGNKDEAEDAAQDTFIKAYRKLSDFRPDSALYTWLYRIAVNTCLDYKKRPFFASMFRGTREDDEVMNKLPSDEPSPERLYESKQTGHALRVGLEQLLEKFRTVLILKEIEGLSYEEIAEVLDISTGTVKSRISRAREELKQLLKNFTEQK
jgi:RNA polymerase sigma-70 factor (ECF subfamily)